MNRKLQPKFREFLKDFTSFDIRRRQASTPGPLDECLENTEHTHVPILTAKVFNSGKSQAIQLPKALRLRVGTAQIEKTARGLLILNPVVETQRVEALSKLYGSCPEFPMIESLAITG
jgi:virulence-associated protein VagC